MLLITVGERDKAEAALLKIGEADKHGYLSTATARECCQLARDTLAERGSAISLYAKAMEAARELIRGDGTDASLQRAIDLSRQARYDPKIWFSGFSSQGDGACFEGTYTGTGNALASIKGHAPEDAEAFTVSSDGHGQDFLDGLALARAALPRVANQLDIPMNVMRDDRWCAPWISGQGESPFTIRFCIDGHGYVLRKATGESYRFATHGDMAKFLDTHKRAEFKHGRNAGVWSYDRNEPNIWHASGAFDQARHDRIAKAQTRVLRTLFPADATHAHQPPAYARPGEMPENAGRAFCYNLSELLDLIA